MTANGIAPERAQRLMRLATYASVSVAGVLIAIKIASWLMTESVSLLSTLVDSLLDAMASMFNLVAVHHALQPADREHRFGHGKAEPLAGLAQAAFIGGSAAFLLFQAVERMVHPRPIANVEIGVGAMVVSIVLTFALVMFQRYVVKKTGSVAVGADQLHYQGDLLTNASVIVSLILASRFGIGLADPLFAIAIAVYIVWSARGIAIDSLNLLMDRELPDEDRRKIRALCEAHPEVRGVHDLRTRSSGQQVFIQLHLELDGAMTLHDVHEVSEAVMHEIEAAFPNAEVIIHEDPEGVPEPRKTFQ